MTTLTLATIDRLSKSTSMGLPVKDAATTPELQAVADALNAVIRGSAVSATKTVPTTIDSGSKEPPADKSANRGNKWQVRIHDAVKDKTFRYEIGTANNDLLSSSDNDYLDITTDPSPGKTLKDAIEAVYESSYENPGTVLSIQHVLRALNN